MALKIGLTGSIGTGKTTVSEIFEDFGAYVIDADKVVHKLLKRKDIKEKLSKVLGNNIFDKNGEIDKKKVADIIFKNPEKKKKIESIIHPEVRKEIKRFIEEVERKDKNAVIIAEIPLLIESKLYKDYDKVIVVYSPKEIQLERLIKKGFSKEEALARINSQMPIEEKLKYADIVIENTGSIEELKEKIKKVFEDLKKEATK
ncbi:dephospho-CoA kinase [Hydrogenothermus marinus]|uniref:Dephospho-CoA kinase n=1 Tax=Hydrogenothermus marinus TaxID=133270 RepID=A0A3M0BFD9_9AQUI|nr:dephospho-CoA kinase [Hydrogenothermus marinus]RMA96030.1 dephospho-CoA kinase [Hydrogenothermus marinus]